MHRDTPMHALTLTHIRAHTVTHTTQWHTHTHTHTWYTRCADFYYDSVAGVVSICGAPGVLIFFLVQQLVLLQPMVHQVCWFSSSFRSWWWCFLWYTRCSWFPLWFSSWCYFYGTPGVLDFHYDSAADVFMIHQGCWSTTTLHSALPKAWPSAVSMQVLAQQTDSMTRYLTFAMSLYADKLYSSSAQFSSRWYLSAWKIPYFIYIYICSTPSLRSFPKHCLWNSSNVHLIDDSPLSSIIHSLFALYLYY